MSKSQIKQHTYNVKICLGKGWKIVWPPFLVLDNNAEANNSTSYPATKDQKPILPFYYLNCSKDHGANTKVI